MNLIHQRTLFSGRSGIQVRSHPFHSPDAALTLLPQQQYVRCSSSDTYVLSSYLIRAYGHRFTRCLRQPASCMTDYGSGDLETDSVPCPLHIIRLIYRRRIVSKPTMSTTSNCKTHTDQSREQSLGLLSVHTLLPTPNMRLLCLSLLCYGFAGAVVSLSTKRLVVVTGGNSGM